jgi:hypothetical protein
MAVENYAEVECNEASSLEITATIQDEDDAAVALAAINSIEMTLVETAGGTIVNSRQKQNVLNANNCTMAATSGLFTWSVQAADTAIVNSATAIGDREVHLATFTVVWDTTKQVQFQVRLKVLNLHSVPQVGA